MNITTIRPEQYPSLLKQIPRLPPKLYVAGQLPPDDYKYICVIGARSYSEYGQNICRKLISGLSGYPVVVVSGLAIGIDSISHEAALAAGLRTISFPGSGLSEEALYPIRHSRLAQKIYESGNALVSPFELDQFGANWTFPVRNRLMAGISHATLIIEARHGSGTLITAEYAAEFNRDIMTVPGSVFDELSYGPHMLLKRGAALVETSDDILENLGFEIASNSGQQKMIRFAELSLSPEEKKVLELVASPIGRDALIERLNVSVIKANVILGNLELRGLIRESGSGVVSLG
jgi:DNA processing protein